MVTPASEKKHHNTYGILTLAVCGKGADVSALLYTVSIRCRTVPRTCVYSGKELADGSRRQLSIAADTGMWSADAEAQAATVLFLERVPNRTEHRSIAAFLKPQSVLRRQDKFSVFF